MSTVDDQQFCLRWNNFQANITSQFETLRDDEDFTDVTIACEGQQVQAHKIILSACSPLFKELFKSNPCSHPIIFMRDVEAQHIVALMEFMYAGEVNVAQAQLSAFLKTAESLKIRGLTDTSPNLQTHKDELSPSKSQLCSSSSTLNVKPRLTKTKISSCSSTVTSSQDVNPASPPPLKKACQMGKNDLQLRSAAFEIEAHIHDRSVAPKVELPDYLSDDDVKDDGCDNFTSIGDITELAGGMEIIPTHSNFNPNQNQTEGCSSIDSRKLHSLDPRPCQECGRVYSNLSNLRQHMKLIHNPTYVECYICKKSFKTDLYLKRHIMGSHDTNRCALKRELAEGKWYNNIDRSKRRNSLPFRLYGESSPETTFNDAHCRLRDVFTDGDRRRLVKLGEGIEICEDQLRSVKWSDYRKLTRGLATILFSPAELATCSVTGQRWSRAGSGERPVKPALDRTKVQAIISYVATRFPMVEISRIKQVLAYKCKENSTAFKMKAVRYYGEQLKVPDGN